MKTCKMCQKEHRTIPSDARAQKDFDGIETVGWVWECDCKSTIFWKTDKLAREAFRKALGVMFTGPEKAYK